MIGMLHWHLAQNLGRSRHYYYSWTLGFQTTHVLSQWRSGAVLILKKMRSFSFMKHKSVNGLYSGKVLIFVAAWFRSITHPLLVDICQKDTLFPVLVFIKRVVPVLGRNDTGDIRRQNFEISSAHRLNVPSGLLYVICTVHVVVTGLWQCWLGYGQ